MTRENDGRGGICHYEYKSLGLEGENGFGDQALFYEENDPRIRLATDRWGKKCIVLGEIRGYDLPCNNMKIDNRYIVYYDGDQGLTGVHKSSIN